MVAIPILRPIPRLRAHANGLRHFAPARSAALRLRSDDVPFEAQKTRLNLVKQQGRNGVPESCGQDHGERIARGWFLREYESEL